MSIKIPPPLERHESRSCREAGLPSEAEALWLLEGAPRKLDLNFSTSGLRLLLPPLSMEAAGPEAAGSCLGKPVSTLMEGAAAAGQQRLTSSGHAMVNTFETAGFPQEELLLCLHHW